MSAHADSERILRDLSALITARVYGNGFNRFGIDPDDVIQEVRLRIWKKFKRERKARVNAFYIIKAIDSVLISQLRKVRTQRRIIQKTKINIIDGARVNPEDSIKDGPLLDEVRAAVISLDGPKRNVVTLYFLNLTVKEISLCFKWSEAKTWKLLRTALCDLKRRIRNGGVGLGS